MDKYLWDFNLQSPSDYYLYLINFNKRIYNLSCVLILLMLISEFLIPQLYNLSEIRKLFQLIIASCFIIISFKFLGWIIDESGLIDLFHNPLRISEDISIWDIELGKYGIKFPSYCLSCNKETNTKVHKKKEVFVPTNQKEELVGTTFQSSTYSTLYTDKYKITTYGNKVEVPFNIPACNEHVEHLNKCTIDDVLSYLRGNPLLLIEFLKLNPNFYVKDSCKIELERCQKFQIRLNIEDLPIIMNLNRNMFRFTIQCMKGKNLNLIV